LATPLVVTLVLLLARVAAELLALALLVPMLPDVAEEVPDDGEGACRVVVVTLPWLMS
jgi:hypothetical protein